MARSVQTPLFSDIPLRKSDQFAYEDEIKELIGNALTLIRKGWCQHAYTIHNHRHGYRPEYSIEGAIHADDGYDVYHRLHTLAYLASLLGRRDLQQWNDERQRRKRDVIALLEHALNQ